MNKKPSLAETHPELAAQAHGWDPTTLSAGSNKKVSWECEFGHWWNSIVANRTKGSGCPVCSGRIPITGISDLATTNSELAAQADGWDPTVVSQGSDKKAGWKCESGHTWNATVSSRSGGNGCPICANRVVLVGFNDLATTNSELAAQADGWDPTTVVANSGKTTRWKCSDGHTWYATLDSRSRGNGCPICSNKKVLAGFNDLATTNPELAAQAHGWDPATVVIFSNKEVGWKCKSGHTWNAAVSSRSGGSGCPICSGHKVLAGFNDLATTSPELAAQADGWDPTSLSAFSNKKVRWCCHLGHSWNAAVNDRSGGRGCPICSGQKVLAGFNDLATKNPELAAQADGWDPTTVTAHTNQSVGWKCDLGHTWKATANNRSGGRGCPSCAEYGFNPAKDGWLYLIENDLRDMFQIGISNFLENRLESHSNGGWEVIEVRGPMDGFLTQDLERFSLKALKRRGALLGRKGSIEKFDGHTEAWTKASLNVTSIKQILDWVYEDERLPIEGEPK